MIMVSEEISDKIDLSQFNEDSGETKKDSDLEISSYLTVGLSYSSCEEEKSSIYGILEKLSVDKEKYISLSFMLSKTDVSIFFNALSKFDMIQVDLGKSVIFSCSLSSAQDFSYTIEQGYEKAGLLLTLSFRESLTVY